jgi:small-conductance mechanosensitive channel
MTIRARAAVSLSVAGIVAGALVLGATVAFAADPGGTVPVSASTSLETALIGVLDLVRERGQLAWQALASSGDDWHRVQAAWFAALASADMLRAATDALVLLLIGGGGEWLYWCYAGGARRAIAEAAMAAAQAGAPPAHAVLALAGRRLLLEAFGLLVFAVAVIGASSAFAWPAGVHEAIVALTLGVAAARAAVITARFVLSPRPARLRLIELDDADARRRYRLTGALAIVLATAYVIGTMVDNAGDLGGLAVVGRVAAGVVTAGLALALIRGRSLDRGRVSRRRGASLLQLVATALIVVALVLYLIDLRVMVASIAVVLLAGIADRTLRAIGDRMTAVPEPRAAIAAAGAESVDGEESADDVGAATALPIDPGRGTTVAAYRSVLHRAFDITVFAGAVVWLAAIWDVPVLELARSGSFAGRLIDVAIVLLMSDLVWVWAKTAIDRRLASIPQANADAVTADPNQRLATLLPLLRKALLILVSTITVLVALSALGVDIAPLLAGASVVGIAVGFGAQTLVRDIVSGVFYLLEDSFRVGEYVEFGNIRGTVEGISLRFLRLRHHRGAVHTIPFGEIRWLTNQSRDWVIVKLELRVPFDTDVERARKLIKKIGLELMEDPELGPCLIEPVKSSGVVRLEEFCMVIGVKFMARPGDGQFLVRREAYRRIRDAFAANDIRFHDRSVKVEVVGQPQDEQPPRPALAASTSPAALGGGAGDIVGMVGVSATRKDP